MGRPPKTLGLWGEMVLEAGGVDGLATLLGLTRGGLNPVFTGRRPLAGPSRVLAGGFARERGITARLYVHPTKRGFFLVSAADGWWELPSGGAWAARTMALRSEAEDWGQLHALELPFERLAEIQRGIPK